MSSLQILLCFALGVGAMPLPPAFEALLPFIRPGVELSQEGEELRLLEPTSGFHFRLGLSSAELSSEDVDLLAHQVIRPDGRTFFYWTMTEALLRDKSRPRRSWGRCLRPEFLATLRPPEESQ